MLLWDKPHLRTPAQFERWSLIVAIVRNHLVLARDLVEVQVRLWENKHRPSTPQQVRRAMSKLLPQLGTLARPPQPRGKSPGRAKGAKIGKATRFPGRETATEAASIGTHVSISLAFSSVFAHFTDLPTEFWEVVVSPNKKETSLV